MRPLHYILLAALAGSSHAHAVDNSLDDAISKLERLSAGRGARPASSEPGTAIISQDPAPATTPAANPQQKAPFTPPAKQSPLPPPAATPPPKPLAIATQTTPPQGETVWALDPRSSISKDQGLKEGYEMTTVSVQRVLTAAGSPKGSSENSEPVWSKRLPITVPVLFHSRTLKLDAKQAERAQAVLKRMEALSIKAAEVKKESEALLADWNAIVAAGTPSAVLFADSPSLPANQSATPINRGEAKPGFDPGKDISFTVQ